MTTATTTHKRTIIDAVLWEPLDLAKSQPHQIALSSASVALMGEFGSSSGILPRWVAYTLAIGVEWAYLKGLASDSRAPTRWGMALNWSAFGIVVLWGVLFVASMIGAIDLHARGLAGWLLAAAHVVPIAWLSLCSAMTHRAALLLQATEDRHRRDAEQARADRMQAERDALRLEADRKAAELASWEAGQRAQLAIELERKEATMRLKMQAQNARPNMRRDARPERTNADEKKCPKCGAELSQPQWLAARRWGHCRNCKEA